MNTKTDQAYSYLYMSNAVYADLSWRNILCLLISVFLPGGYAILLVYFTIWKQWPCNLVDSFGNLMITHAEPLWRIRRLVCTLSARIKVSNLNSGTCESWSNCMDAHSVWISAISSYVTFVCIHFSISTHLSGGKAALTKFAWRVTIFYQVLVYA